jgi:succinoglycan biosynthesis transport protein ExoP
MSTGPSEPAPYALTAGAMPVAPGAEFDGPEDGGGGVDIKRALAAIGRYRWLILGLALGGLAAGFGLGQIVKPIYEAQASIQIPVQPRGFGSPSPLRSAPLFEGRAWVELVRSFEVLDQVVRDLRLYLEPAVLADSAFFRQVGLDTGFVPGTYQLSSPGAGRMVLARQDGSVIEEVASGDSLGRSIGLLWAPSAPPVGRVVEFRVRMPRDAAVRLGEALGTQLPPDGALLRMSLRGQDPVLTAVTVNAVATQFVAVATLLKREKLTTVTNVLREQLESARVDLTNAEQALQLFKVNTITLPSDRGATPIATGLAETADPVRLAFFQLRLDREALVRQRDAVVRALEPSADTTRSIVVSLGTISAVRESPELLGSLNTLTEKRAEARSLRMALAPTHPQIQQIEREIAALETATIPAQAASLIQNLNVRIGEFDQRIAASSREMQQIPVRSTEEARRERNVEVAELIYSELESAYQQARLSELSAAPDVRLLDSAVPPTRPVRDQILLIIVGGMFGGLGLGIALAILLDRVDTRIRYPDQVTHDLGLSILGAVPLLVTGRDGKPRPDDAAHVLEAMRSIRMALLYAHGAAGPFITTVTSPGSGDGKSFVSANLARTFASTGRKTLLIDGDNRRGGLHRALGVDRKPGLTDILRGTVTPEDAIRTVADAGIDFLPGGTRMASAPELLASLPMQQLMLRLRGEYQAIIIDSPPLGAGVDPLVLASLSGTLVMVLRNGVTDRELAGARLDDLHRLPIRVLGAVLNDVKAEGIYRYYSYTPGYRPEDEEEAATPPPRRLLGLK